MSDLVQVIVPLSLQGAFKDWIASRGLYLYPIPVDDDLPTYGIGVHPEAPLAEGSR